MTRTTYVKPNGDIVQRETTMYNFRRVGDTNSYNWEVIKIEYKYKDKYYLPMEYDELMQKLWKKSDKKEQIIKIIKNSSKFVCYVDFIFIVLRCAKIIIINAI